MSKNAESDQFNPEISMAKAALWPSLIVAVVSILVSLLFPIAHQVSTGASNHYESHRDISRSSIILGAVFASLTVIIFFGVSLLISLISNKVDPNVVMVLAMFSFFIKIVLLGIGLALLGKFSTPSQVNRTSFLITAIALIVTWIVGEIVGFLKLKFQMPLPKQKGA